MRDAVSLSPWIWLRCGPFHGRTGGGNSHGDHGEGRVSETVGSLSLLWTKSPHALPEPEEVEVVVMDTAQQHLILFR